MYDLLQFLDNSELLYQNAISALSEVSDWGLQFTNISDIQKFTKGAGVTIAVLDTGVFPHIDIGDNLIQTLGVNNNTYVVDTIGHGTHVAGIIAAKQNDTGVVGISPESKIVSIKVLNQNGFSTYYEVYKGIELAIQYGVDIISMSLNSLIEPPEIFHKLIKKAYDKGIIILSCAGNESTGVGYPAKYDEVIAVGAMDQFGNLASFSNRGQEISVIAPGINIYSTFLNNQYVLKSGTSMSTPFVAGICALLLANNKKNIKNTQDMLRILDEYCDPLGKLHYSGKDSNIGFGIPNFANYKPWKEN